MSVVATAWEVERLRAIEADGGAPIPVVTLPDVDPVPRFRPARYRTLLLLAGRKHKIRKGDVLGALVKDVGLPPDAIGAIHLSQRICAVAVERKHAVRALRGLRRGRVKKQRVRVTLLGSAR